MFVLRPVLCCGIHSVRNTANSPISTCTNRTITMVTHNMNNDVENEIIHALRVNVSWPKYIDLWVESSGGMHAPLLGAHQCCMFN